LKGAAIGGDAIAEVCIHKRCRVAKPTFSQNKYADI
jgi:hypothetical protein